MERMFRSYVRPQATDNSLRMSVESFLLMRFEGLAFRSDASFQFDVIPFTDENLECWATHINQLRREVGVFCFISMLHRQIIVTNIPAYGVLPQYRVPVQDYTFRFTIRPLK